MLNKEQITELARISGLEMTDRELETAMEVLNRTIDNLNTLTLEDEDTRECEKYVRNGILRDDVVSSSLSEDELFSSALDYKKPFFTALKVVH